MSIRQVARRVAASLAAIAAALAATAAVGTLSLVAFGSPAGADTSCTNSGDQCLNAAQPTTTVPPGPFDSGQNIKFVIPANNAFAGSSAGIQIVECMAPNGVIPTDTSTCDGNTINGSTILPTADGSFTFPPNKKHYAVYALPDSIKLGESSSSPVTCGNTAATECIFYIGDNSQDFTQPHLWSQPFLVNTDPTDSGTINPGDGTPEVPMAIILPIAAMGLLGAVVLVRRRRTAHPASASEHAA